MRTYKERKQPKERRQYGKLEKKKDLMKRLGKIKKQNADIRNAQEEIRNKTGQEYFFGYHSVEKKNSDICKLDNPTAEELARMRIYIDSEIHRSEKKLEKHIPRPASTHIKFESDSETKEDLFDFERSEATRRAFEEYIEQMKTKRKEVVKRIEMLKRTAL